MASFAYIWEISVFSDADSSYVTWERRKKWNFQIDVKMRDSYFAKSLILGKLPKAQKEFTQPTYNSPL